MSKKQFSWLHLSDSHIGQKAQWLWPNFKAIFLADLQRLSDETGPIDLVLFSGDLVQSGTKSEFDTLTRELTDIWERLEKLGNRPFLFCVPGNHDLERPPENDARVRMLARWQSEPSVAKELWEKEDNQYIELMRSAFSNYAAWQNEIASHGIPVLPVTKGLLPGDTSGSHVFNDISVGLVGLNSSFLQLSNENFQEKLSLDPRQLNAVTDNNPPAWCEKHDINFLITHHPPSWLSTEARHEFLSEIYPPGRFTAHLCGHMHEAELTRIYQGGNSGRKFFQSSSLFGMEYLADGKTERTHGYSIGQISFQSDQPTWKLWPRRARSNKKGGDRKLIPDHDNFELVDGHEYQQEALEKSTPSSKPVVIASSPTSDLQVAVEKGINHLNNVLQSSLHTLIEQNQHLAIRTLQQQSCAESIKRERITWVCSDWGLGSDGFIWSVTKRLSPVSQPAYRITLSNYGSREEFLAGFSKTAGCSFQEFCNILAGVGPSILIFDDSPVGVGDVSGYPIERDVEDLAKLVCDFCTDIVVVLLTRGSPRNHRLGAVKLEPLDEADTRTYLMAHPNSKPDIKTSRGVSEIYRRTDGLPSKIDSTLQTLRVVNLSELGPAVSITHSNDAVVLRESAPTSLIKAVSELAESRDPSSKRSYLLLKVLAVLPHGESLQRLKHLDHRNPVFPKHAEELLDLDLIEVRTSADLIGIHSTNAESVKLLVAPRPVRDYVITRLSAREIDTLVSKAVDLYFGKDWRSGKASLKKLGDELTSDDGSLLVNPHTLVLRLIEKLTQNSPQENASSIMNLCLIYCNALLKNKNYRSCVAVCRDILQAMPSAGLNSYRDSIELFLGKSLRMSSEHSEARTVFELQLKKEWPKDRRAELFLDYALCLQALDDMDAIVAAKEVIALAPHTALALQAQSIILEMEADIDNTKRLAKLESQARKLGYDTVANNLTLDRISYDDDYTSYAAALRTVYQTAVSTNDPYNAARAAVKIGTLSYKDTKSLSDGDLNKLISAYQYFYGERFDSLFQKAHKTLWSFFEDKGDSRNLLTLFRHSSFIWRLHGNENREKYYVQQMLSSYRKILTTDVLTADKNTAYFLIRAREGAQELPSPTKSLGETGK